MIRGETAMKMEFLIPPKGECSQTVPRSWGHSGRAGVAAAPTKCGRALHRSRRIGVRPSGRTDPVLDAVEREARDHAIGDQGEALSELGFAPFATGFAPDPERNADSDPGQGAFDDSEDAAAVWGVEAHHELGARSAHASGETFASAEKRRSSSRVALAA
jgi:hypothetical protein